MWLWFAYISVLFLLEEWWIILSAFIILLLWLLSNLLIHAITVLFFLQQYAYNCPHNTNYCYGNQYITVYSLLFFDMLLDDSSLIQLCLKIWGHITDIIFYRFIWLIYQHVHIVDIFFCLYSRNYIILLHESILSQWF